MSAFAKLLIANRGEIAVRVIRGARALGYRTVAVYSAADAGAPHVRAADEAVAIGPAPAAESYLNIEAILGAARASGADAVHPGYGFLAENPDFARACGDAGLVFIGPDPDAIHLMGNKRQAKARLAEAGIAGVPGYHGADQSDEALIAAAREIGAPLMVKAAVGGGGRGLRRVDDLEGIAAALAAARSESLSAFGDDELILEKALDRPRHVEIQVFGDRHGNIVHLGERDCSIQRRHQKIIEEAPSPAVKPELREAMGASAVAAAREIGYVGAGTVEFLLDAEGDFHFLEMNTRLQVEHPVTELITGLDLVAWQLLVAAGEPLPLAQDQVSFRGHAIEARLYAEDAYAGFLPQSGRILAWAPPQGEGIRVDHGIESGFEVSPHYDPLLAKVVAWGEDRETARRRLVRAVDDCTLLGITSNKHFLGAVLRHPEFVAADADTGFVERTLEAGGLAAPAAGTAMRALAAVLLAEHGIDELDSWSSTGTLAWSLRLGHGGEEIEASVTWRRQGYRVRIDQAEAEISILEKVPGQVRFRHDGVDRRASFEIDGDVLWLDWEGQVECFAERRLGGGRGGDDFGDDRLLAPMDGRIVAVMVAEGEAIEAGQCVVVLEAMKMQHEIRSGRAGTVDRVAVREGDQVAARQVLVELAPEETDGE